MLRRRPRECGHLRAGKDLPRPRGEEGGAARHRAGYIFRRDQRRARGGCVSRARLDDVRQDFAGAGIRRYGAPARGGEHPLLYGERRLVLRPAHMAGQARALWRKARRLRRPVRGRQAPAFLLRRMERAGELHPQKRYLRRRNAGLHRGMRRAHALRRRLR